MKLKILFDRPNGMEGLSGGKNGSYSKGFYRMTVPTGYAPRTL